MPPARTPSKSGADIRSMFASQAASQSRKAQGSGEGNAIEISDDEKPKQQTKRKKPSALLSSDEEDGIRAATPPPTKKKAETKKIAAANGFTNTKPRPSTSTPIASSSKDKPKATPTPTKAKPASRKAKKDDDYEEESEASGSESEDDEEEDVKPTKKSATKTKTKEAVKRPKKRPKLESDEEEVGSPSNLKARAAEVADPPKPKFDWAAKAARLAARPVASGSKAVPEPKTMDCLMGLTFVFTGELSSFSRDEAIDIAKRYGGRVTLQPSSKTSYVILGDDAGPAKLKAIEKNNLKTLNEDQFLNLIATRVGPSGKGGKVDEKLAAKMKKEQRAIEEGAKELEQRERDQAKAAKKAQTSGSAPKAKPVDASTQLWTQRYAPQTLKEICGNKSQVEKLQQWLHDWPNSLKAGFKKPGKNGMNVFRAILITGPPGIGKTTSAHLVAKLEGYTPIELNASDARSKKLVESSTNIMNQSLDGWMGGGDATNAAGIKITEKSCLIMDEVDGMSAGDRGGIGALNALIRKTRIPIICIANDRTAQKMKPLQGSTFSLTFKRPEAATIRSRIMSIAFREKLKVPANVVDQLINSAQSDIRQVLNMLSTWKLSSDSMDFDEGKTLAKLNEKHTIMTPYNVISKVFGPYTFSPTSKETLSDKMELYFHDHAFIPLFVQENYLRALPNRLKNLDGPPKVLKHLELMDKAASSISDSDLIDSMIHGPEQHWSLMPLHSVSSFVYPASLLYGFMPQYSKEPGTAISFPQWLGQNSKGQKLSRQLSETQIRMRLKVSGDKAEIRQSYLPALFPHIVKPLMDDGVSAVEEVIDYMDEYYLNKEDWDTIVELGVGDKKDDLVLKKIAPTTKTALTRKYNSTEHPVPFHKAVDLGKIPKKLTGGPAPDLEEAFEDDDAVEEEDDDKQADDDDISKDKLLKPKKPRAATNATKAKPKIKK